MKYASIEIGNALEKNRKRVIKQRILYIAVVIAFALMIVIGIFDIRRHIQDNVIELEETAVDESAVHTGEYLLEGVDAVRDLSGTIDHLLEEGARADELPDYLEERTEVLPDVLDAELDRIYGVIDGQFVTGNGWSPEEGYTPEQQSWYKAAMDADGEVAFTTPYVDKASGKVIMSISRALQGDRGVICIDLGMDQIQEVTKARAERIESSYAFVLDSKGTVVSHTAVSNIGQSYLDGKENLGNAVASRLYSEQDGHYEITYKGVKYMVFYAKTEADWYAVTVADEKQLFPAPIILYLAFSLVLVIFAAAIVRINMNINRNRAEFESLNMLLKSISGVYAIVYLIDLNEDTFEEIVSTDSVRDMLRGEREHARDTLNAIMELRVNEISKRNILEFVNSYTLDERMAGTGSVTQEFLNDKNVWCRARFIAVDYNESGILHHVLWLVEVIDEEKRQRDKLLMLSETDRMTKLLNRGGGEMKIRQMLEGGRSGMFCLMDADHFKSFNDNYGHDVGDKVIIAIADCLRKSFRGNDIVMRLGGDEYAVYAPTVITRDIAEKIMERLFDNIEHINIPELSGKPIHISVGAAFYLPDDNSSFEELYKRADKGTYNSKKHEGNYVTFEEDV